VGKGRSSGATHARAGNGEAAILKESRRHGWKKPTAWQIGCVIGLSLPVPARSGEGWAQLLFGAQEAVYRGDSSPRAKAL